MKARRLMTILLLTLTLLASFAPVPAAAQGRSDAPAGRSDAPAGQMTWAVHVSLSPVWFDPAEHTGIITLMMVLYAVHDAMVKPMPGNPMAPSLAESWTASKDGLSYEFVLRKGVRFRLKEPWPDFMTFYATPASGAGWIVPKKYVEQVGDEGFKKAPIGAGPY